MSDVFYNPTSETTRGETLLLYSVGHTNHPLVCGGRGVGEGQDSTECENQEARVVMGCHPGDCDHSLKESLLVPNSTQTSVGDKCKFHF